MRYNFRIYIYMQKKTLRKSAKKASAKPINLLLRQIATTKPSIMSGICKRCLLTNIVSLISHKQAFNQTNVTKFLAVSNNNVFIFMIGVL